MQTKALQGEKALEMAMRDSMENLCDAASYFAYSPSPETLQILSIEAPKGDPFASSQDNQRSQARAHGKAQVTIVDLFQANEAHLERISEICKA